MKKLVFLILPLFLISTSILSQKKQAKESSIYVSGILNINQEEFVVTYNETIEFPGSTGSESFDYNATLPRSKTNIGFSIHKIDPNKIYQEFAVTRLSFTDKDNTFTRTRSSSTGTTVEHFVTSNTLWDIQTRYEIGKNFISDKKNKINIGLGLAIEPSLLFSRIDADSNSSFVTKRIRARTHFTIVPVTSFNINPNFTVALKIIPSIFFIDWNRISQENLNLGAEQRISIDFESTLFNNNIATNIIVRYRFQLKEETKKHPKK